MTEIDAALDDLLACAPPAFSTGRHRVRETEADTYPLLPSFTQAEVVSAQNALAARRGAVLGKMLLGKVVAGPA